MLLLGGTQTALWVDMHSVAIWRAVQD